MITSTQARELMHAANAWAMFSSLATAKRDRSWRVRQPVIDKRELAKRNFKALLEELNKDKE